MLPAIFFSVLGVSVLVALAARIGMKNVSIGDYLVGGRSFPAWLLYFLAVGEIYSIGTMIGLPSGLYTGGASYGVWFVGYILMAYPLGYFVAPLVWRSGIRYDAMTIPDVFGRHFRSRSLEVVTAVALLVALVPWGQYQFIGLQVVLGGLGMHISPLQSVIVAAVIAFVYLAVSGVRSPAFVSILKDAFMLLGILIVGIVAVHHAGGTSAAFRPGKLPAAMTTLSGSPLVFTITTIVFQSITFYLGFSATYLFTAKSERAIKSSVVWMPMYMLMYPFLFLASFYAVARYPHLKQPNGVFMRLTADILPPWLVGVVAAGAGLSGILVLAVTALSIGGIVTRNLVPGVRPERQKRISNLVVACFLVVAAILTVTGSSIMLTVLNLTYYLLGQLVPGWLALLFFRRVQAWAVSIGIVVGLVASIAFYVTKPDLGGINGGLIAVVLNVVLTFGLSALRPAEGTEPMSRWRAPAGAGSVTGAEQDASTGPSRPPAERA
jgi:SSS family solute:Na+ symporter